MEFIFSSRRGDFTVMKDTSNQVNSVLMSILVSLTHPILGFEMSQDSSHCSINNFPLIQLELVCLICNKILFYIKGKLDKSI